MAFRHIFAADISYPAVILHRAGFEVWSDSETFDPACAEELRQRIGLMVSAQGHFERLGGFGLPDTTAYASIAEVLTVFFHSGFRKWFAGVGLPRNA
ncbi:MAG TPA: hypothetical protein VH436_17550 [Vicinamibacterales bacterium]|jgi:hypothetical protein